MQKARLVADTAIYISIILGPLLLTQVYGIVPLFLFYSLLAGWLVYLVTGVAVALKRKGFYALASALSILVLALSLSQPEHYLFIMQGKVYEALTFVVGDVVQLFVLAGSLKILTEKGKK